LVTNKNYAVIIKFDTVVRNKFFEISKIKIIHSIVFLRFD